MIAMKLTKESYEVSEIAELLSVTDATVRVWINTGRLKAFKCPGSGAQCIVRVFREDLERFLKTYSTDERN